MQQYLLGEQTFDESQLMNQAEKWGVSLEELLKANPDIKIDESSQEDPTDNLFRLGENTFSHDQLSKQAEKWGVSLEELLKANPDIKRNIDLPKVTKEDIKVTESKL